MLFDTHTHYDDKQFDKDRDELLLSLRENGVGHVVTVGACMKTSRAALELAEKYDFIYASAGVHPSEIDNLSEKDMVELESLCGNKKVRALGEIGLDYHYKPFDREKQIFWFDCQMQLAKKLKMPVIIHEREAFSDTYEVLKKYKDEVFGVVHCFSGSAEGAKMMIDLGYLISFTGVITFKNAKKPRQVTAQIPLDKIMIETDCPYLSPEPFRGSRNDSRNVCRVAQEIALIKNISYETVCETTYENAMNFYGIEG